MFLPPNWHYQDDLVTPGISPSSASSLKQMRHKPNRRRYPRGRPQRLQRLRTWLGYFLLNSRYSMHFFAILVLPERHAKHLQQSCGLFIRWGRSYDGDFHTTDLIHFVILDLREDDLFP